MSLGFKEGKLLNQVINAVPRRNEFTRISPDILLTYICYPQGEIRDTHTHPELRITFVRNGKGTLEYDKKKYKLEQGVISVIMAEVPHALYVSKETDLNICEMVIDNS